MATLKLLLDTKRQVFLFCFVCIKESTEVLLFMRNSGYKVLNMEVGFVLSGCHCLLIGAVTTALLGYVWKRLRSYCFTRVILCTYRSNSTL